MIQSVQAQTYPNWELCLADGSDDAHQNVEAIVRQLAKKDSRIRYQRLEKNMGISGNTNVCIDMSTGQYIALFDHDDLLHPSALYEAMNAICSQNADFIFTDEIVFHGSIYDHIAIHLKEEYDRDILLSNNYICHFSVFSREVLGKAGGFRSDYDGSQYHDFILRATEQAQHIVHIPLCLYYWRSHPNSVASDISSKTYAIQAGINAVSDNLKQHEISAQVSSSEIFPAIYQIRYALTAHPIVSVIITGRKTSSIERCVRAAKSQLNYDALEFLAVLPTDISVPESLSQMCSVLQTDQPPQNYAAAKASGDYLLFLSDRMFFFQPNFVQEMLSYALRSDIGVVGGKVYDERKRVHHAGMVLNYCGFPAESPTVRRRIPMLDSVAVCSSLLPMPLYLWIK